MEAIVARQLCDDPEEVYNSEKNGKTEDESIVDMSIVEFLLDGRMLFGYALILLVVILAICLIRQTFAQKKRVHVEDQDDNWAKKTTKIEIPDAEYGKDIPLPTLMKTSKEN